MSVCDATERNVENFIFHYYISDILRLIVPLTFLTTFQA